MPGADDYVEMSATCFIEAFKNPSWWPERSAGDGVLQQHVWGKDGLIETVIKAQKFVMGDYFQMKRSHDIEELANTAIEFFSNNIEIMPFPECWFEWTEYAENDDGKVIDIAKTVCVVNRRRHGIGFQYFGSMSSYESLTSDWWFSGWTMILGNDGTIGWCKCEKDPSLSGEPVVNRFGPGWNGPCVGDFNVMKLTLAAMAMLMSRDAKVVEKRPPSGLIKHRAKKGKVPLFSHHVVTINPQRIIYEGGDGSQPGGPKRTSPRLHWRRGHVRTLSSGKKIGIPPSIIGAKNGGGGVIDKTYRVRADHV